MAPRSTACSIGTLSLLLVFCRSEISRSEEQRVNRPVEQGGQGEGSGVTAGLEESHVYVASEDGSFKLELGGRFQLDYRAYSHQGTAEDANERATAPNTFLARRARFEVEGTLFKNPKRNLYFDFKVQADFADVESTLLRDGYLNIHIRDALEVMAGQFKAPFSQEELQSSKYINFVERSMLNNLAPSRSPGVMVYGETGKSLFQYAFSAQNDRGELGLDPSGVGPDLFGRVRFKPWQGGMLQNLAFGGAVGKGQRNNETFIVGRTSSRSVVFYERVPLDGDLVRRNLEAAWYFQNLGIESEYDDTRAQRLGLGAEGGDLPDIEARGYLFQAMYIITGEKKGESCISPKRSLQDGGAGAWEAAFRYERFEVGEGSRRPNVVQTYTIGINWWWNRFMRYQSNLLFERFRSPPSGFAGDSILAYLTRIQVIF